MSTAGGNQHTRRRFLKWSVLGVAGISVTGASFWGMRERLGALWLARRIEQLVGNIDLAPDATLRFSEAVIAERGVRGLRAMSSDFLVTQFLFSTDHFRGAEGSRRFLSLWSPYAMPCGNPLATFDD